MPEGHIPLTFANNGSLHTKQRGINNFQPFVTPGMIVLALLSNTLRLGHGVQFHKGPSTQRLVGVRYVFWVLYASFARIFSKTTQQISIKFNTERVHNVFPADLIILL